MCVCRLALGIDTSNYTTSAAIYNLSDGSIIQRRKLLPVGTGKCGLRQSDAVFHHTQQLHSIIADLLSEIKKPYKIEAIGVSSRPRDIDGSYMPCFTVGLNTANIIGSVLNVPVYYYSHQMGHIAAAIYSADANHFYDKDFIAFHVSGGTTEAVLVKPNGTIEIVGKSLDLHAGQAIDRIGVSMGLSFPCGKALEELALKCQKEIRVKTCIKNTDCCLSGIENICENLLKNNVEPSEVALTCLTFIGKSIEGMCLNIIDKYGKMPILFAGGVMSNSIIRKALAEKFDCYFALQEYSTDNACGIAVMAGDRYIKEFIK